jgi:hypothetical protein
MTEPKRTQPSSKLSARPLSSWNEGKAKDDIIRFVRQTCGDGTAQAVPVEDRVAVFDNDGTLWCEKPMPIQLDFILRRLVEMAQQDDGLRQELYGVPRERVIGSATTPEYLGGEYGGTVNHRAKADYLDDGAEKPVRIWSRTGRRPVFAAGNSNGDVPMLDFTQHDDKPFLRLLVLHDDAEREYDYVAGAEQALERAAKRDWTVVSIRDDWTTVF